MTFDFIIIGGGIVGVSTAWQLTQRFPNKSILLIEKEHDFALHQTGHNSGVIHAGVYYQPGSLKAQFCKQGLERTIEFCKQHNIAFEQCGKLLVATNKIEQERMYALYERCQTNKIDVDLINQQQLNKLEPNINGLGAIHVKDTAIVNYQQITKKLAELFAANAGEFKLNTCVNTLIEENDKVRVKTTNGEFKGRFLISCTGLMADRILSMLDIPHDFKIVPFRGEYYQLPEHKNNIVNHLIYPIPDPDLPFLGIHLTKMIDGRVTVGPNAVLGFKREGYGKLNIDARDIKDMFLFPGFWKVAKNHLKSGYHEFKNSVLKRSYLKNVQKYCPSLQLDDLQAYPAGIRAQAVMRDGTLVHDFLFSQSKRTLHVCNAPSPAATSALPIGHYIADKVENEIAKLSRVS